MISDLLSVVDFGFAFGYPESKAEVNNRNQNMKPTPEMGSKGSPGMIEVRAGWERGE